MRYIGNKENIIEKIHSILQENNVQGESFFDFFSGTTSAGRFYKELNYRILSSDILYFSFCLQKAYLENNSIPKFEKLLPALPNKNIATNLFATPLDSVLSYLNSIPDVQGFIYNNYTPAGTSHLGNLACILAMKTDCALML